MKIGSTEERESAIKVGEEDVALRLREKLKRLDSRSSGSSYPTYTLKPTGSLILEITDYISATNNVTAWWDTKTWPLENQIQDIVEGIGEAGEALRKLKIERAEREKRHREEEGQRLASRNGLTSNVACVMNYSLIWNGTNDLLCWRG